MRYYAQFDKASGRHVGFISEEDIGSVNDTYFTYTELPDGFHPDTDTVEGSQGHFKVIWGDLSKQQTITDRYPPSKQINIMREALVAIAKAQGIDCPALFEMDAFINRVLGDENE